MEKPLIGVVPLVDEEKQSLWMLPGYFDGIRAAGGLPLMLPLEADEEDLTRLLTLCAGVLFTGGQDVDPARYKATPHPRCGAPCPARDGLEERLFRLAWSRDLPMLGICRGLQLFNVLLGGTLCQDLPTERPGGLDHQMAPPYDRVCHAVSLVPGTPLGDLLGRECLGVNSYHHQAVRDLAPGLMAMAWSPDGLAEAAYAPERRFLWAVQWHPEFSFRSDPASRAIFGAFVEHCR